MKRIWKRLTAMTLVLVLSLTACGGSGGSGDGGKDAGEDTGKDTGGTSGTVTTMKVSIGVPETHFEYIACEKMKEHIESATGGSIQVELYASNQIGNDQEVFEGLPLGVAQMVPCGSDIIGNFCKEFSLLSLPYLFDDIAQVDEVMTGQFGQDLLAKLEDLGYVGLGFGDFGFRHITNNVRPITTVEDLKGLKLRTMTVPIHLEMFEAMGASPTPMASSEVFSALQQGVVDGQENPCSNIYSNKYHEVQKYMTLDGHVFTFVTFVCAKNWFEGLTEAEQTAVREGVAIATQHMSEACAAEDEAALQKMIDEGLEVTELTPEAKEGFRAAVAGVQEKNGSAINAEMYQQMMDAIAAAA